VDAMKSRLEKLREDKSPDDDDFSPRLLTMISDETALPVTILFNQSMIEGDVPFDWKSDDVMPIFKKESINQPENFQPVSLTSQLSKVMESSQYTVVCCILMQILCVVSQKSFSLWLSTRQIMCY